MSPYAPLVILVGLAAIAGGSYLAGDRHGGAAVQAKWDAAKVVQQAAVIKQDKKVAVATATQTSDAAAVGATVVHDTEYIHEKAKRILVKIPVYIPASANSACTINAGFNRVWNYANGGILSRVPAGAHGGQQPAAKAQGSGGVQPATAAGGSQ